MTRQANPAWWMLLAAFLGVASACSSSGGSWSSIAALPVPLADLALVGLNGKLYAIGGYSGSTLPVVYSYDPASGAWTRRADMRSPRREFAAGALNGKIYVACGMNWTNANSVTFVTTTEEYDPVADTWSERAPCPLPPPNNPYGAHIGGAVANGRLYMISYGGTFAYDPGSDTWTARAAPPFSVGYYSVAGMGGALYLLASDYNGKTDFAQYDPVGDFWIIRPSGGAWASSLVGVDGKLFAVGGAVPVRQLAVALAAVDRYDTSTNSWSEPGWMGVARYLPGAAALGSDLYVVGGSSTSESWTRTPLPDAEAAASW